VSPAKNNPPHSGKITDIKSVKRDTERVAIFFEDVYIGSLSVSRLSSLNLTVGQELTEEELEGLLEETEITKATLSSLKLLSYRARSEKEIRDRLKLKGFTERIITRVIDKLYGWDYLNDRDFARSWVKHRTTGKKPYGSKYIRYELRQKGIDEELINEVLSKIDETKLCEKAGNEVLKRLMKKYKDIELRERIYQHLIRRGFPPNIVIEIIEKLQI